MRRAFTAHLGAGDEDKVLPSFSIEEGHTLRFGIVSGHFEWKNLKILQTWRHREDTRAVSAVVEVAVRRGGLVRVRNACGVSADDVEIRAGHHAAFSVPLHLEVRKLDER